MAILPKWNIGVWKNYYVRLWQVEDGFWQMDLTILTVFRLRFINGVKQLTSLV